MDFETYQQTYFTDPPPEPVYEYKGMHGVTLFYQDFEAAVAYYSSVLGPPAYLEGEGTRGWHIDDTWLTLLQGQRGNPTNVEINFVMTTPAEADRLQAAFIAAGGTGKPPSIQFMYAPVRHCPVRDPFGTDIWAFLVRVLEAAKLPAAKMPME